MALTDPIGATVDTITFYVSCGVQIVPALDIIVSADTTICSNLNGSADITAMAQLAGQLHSRMSGICYWDSDRIRLLTR